MIHFSKLLICLVVENFILTRDLLETRFLNLEITVDRLDEFCRTETLLTCFMCKTEVVYSPRSSPLFEVYVGRLFVFIEESLNWVRFFLFDTGKSFQ